MTDVPTVPTPRRLWNAGTGRFGCFDRDLLRSEMVARGITEAELADWTRLSLSTIQNARAGRTLRERTAIAILRALEMRPKMGVAV